MASSAAAKRGYHHGDLRNALIAAAAELAAKGGPASVTIRATARAVGVTPTAAYRHFAGHEELLTAAKEHALSALTAAMCREVAAREPLSDDPVYRALARLGALGLGYVAFAREQPGLFRTVFAMEGPFPLAKERDADNPFAVLLQALDELVEVGYLPPERRPMAEIEAWALVHGLATLVDGPLRDLPADVRDQAIVRSMLTLAQGLRGTGLTPEQEALLAKELAG